MWVRTGGVQWIALTLVHFQKNKAKYKNKKQEKMPKGNTQEMNAHTFETCYECRDKTKFKKNFRYDRPVCK